MVAEHDFKFQSPDGDFVYSDPGMFERLGNAVVGFNPLTGISSILTRPAG